MIRRISTKWILTVLAAVLLPFLGFAWFVDTEMANRHLETVRYYLLRMAGEVADRLDNEVHERQNDILTWSQATPLAQWTITGGRDEENVFKSMLTGGFDRFVKTAKVYDLILAINAKGELVVSNTHDVSGAPLSAEVLKGLDRDYSKEPWFQTAIAGENALVDHHVTSLLPPRKKTDYPHPENYHIGFAVPVPDQLEPQKTAGVVYALMNWSEIQKKVVHKESLKIPSSAPDIYKTSYVWLWDSDCDTILAHPTPGLYTHKVSEPPIDLPQLVAAAKASDWDMYPEYWFKGAWKNAAFKHCTSRADGGFGWVVGVGIENDDIYQTVHELRFVLWSATGIVLSIVVAVSVLAARRTTRPILELKTQAQRVAGGDLDARIADPTDDEIGDLGRAFNEMTSDLRESRTKLIKAEKDAAWREMARQVAHEIKNPLTPIKLSVNLLERAHAEHSPEFDAIFDRTIELVQRQVDAMRKIALDFAAFAGARKPELHVVELAEVVGEVVDMNSAWAQDLGVEVRVSLVPGKVLVDRGELRRVLINLVSNALEAMGEGGQLDIALARRVDNASAQLVLEIKDRGAGLSDSVRKRLFEPYFTTRTHGTGLGLAIARRLVEEMNGTIALEPRPEGEGPGSVARVVLPEHRDDHAPSDKGDAHKDGA
jgi:signal transduction histidine kinase